MLFILPTNTCFWIGCDIDDIESYKNIYKIKWRDFSKPMAIFIDDIRRFKYISNLTKEQIDFLKNYEKPWTVLIDKKDIKDKKILEAIDNLPNKEQYKKIAFRVAHTFMQRIFIYKRNYFFLTSANKSWQWELIESKKVKEIFKDDIEKYKIRYFAHDDYIINSRQKFSDIFEFSWKTTKIHYLRKW